MRAAMRDALADYLDGSQLWGDDFEPHEIAAWFEEEREAYASLGEGSPTAYGYHALNQRHGFRWIGNGPFDHVLGFGSARGHELEPIVARARRITLVEPSRVATAAIGGVPVEHVAPVASGILPFADATFDLITCFGVLHHIPNVSRVLAELHRCLRPGGHALVREPVVSMGDWRRPRVGLTRRERGLPLAWFERALANTNFTIRRATPCWFPVVTRLAHALGARAPFNRTAIVAVDEVAARAFAWNLRYHATTIFQKLRPTSMFFVLER